jgi:hypothetical protein
MPSPTYHYVNTETRLFVNPLDCEIPSSEHPCIPITGEATLAMKLLLPNGQPYPMSDRSSASLGVTMDGVLIFTSISQDIREGLDGAIVFSLNPVKGVVMNTGTAQMSVLVDGVFVLNDSVSLVGAPVPNPVGCGCPEYPRMTNLGVIEQYVEPSEEMTGQYVLYLGATGQLIRGCIYKCDLVDGSYAWVPKTDPADDNLRLIEWQP